MVGDDITALVALLVGSKNVRCSATGGSSQARRRLRVTAVSSCVFGAQYWQYRKRFQRYLDVVVGRVSEVVVMEAAVSEAVFQRRHGKEPQAAAWHSCTGDSALTTARLGYTLVLIQRYMSLEPHRGSAVSRFWLVTQRCVARGVVASVSRWYMRVEVCRSVKMCRLTRRVMADLTCIEAR